MDPLQQLYDLYENEMSMMSVMDKPDLQEPDADMMGTPQRGNFEHPIIQQRQEVDKLRKSGMSPEDAHQEIHGEVDLGDVEHKKKLASTLGRVQDDGAKNGVKMDKNADFKSILAIDAEIEKATDQVTPDDMRTPMAQQVPDFEQQVEETKCGKGEYFCTDKKKCMPIPERHGVDKDGWLYKKEEYDYNEDVMYLQQYGRA